MTGPFILTPSAARDLDEILEYVLEHSGANPALHVHNCLYEGFSKVAAQPGIGHVRESVLLDGRCLGEARLYSGVDSLACGVGVSGLFAVFRRCEGFPLSRREASPPIRLNLRPRTRLRLASPRLGPKFGLLFGVSDSSLGRDTINLLIAARVFFDGRSRDTLKPIEPPLSLDPVAILDH